MKIRIWFLVPIVLFLSSCLSYEEKLTLNPDGSGKVRAQISLTQIKIDEGTEVGLEAAKKLRGLEGITVVNSTTEHLTDKTVVTLNLNFKHWENLKPIKLKEELADVPDFLGSFDIAEDAEGRLIYSRTVGVESEKGGFAMGLIGGLFRDFTWNYTVEFPGPIAETNADSTMGNQAVWKVSLGSALKKPFMMTAKVESEVDTTSEFDIILGSIVLLIFIGLLAWRRART